jgi:chaperonin GroEL
MTDPEIGERRDRIDDALYAARAASEMGIVVGGGCALARCSVLLMRPFEGSDSSIKCGYDIVKRSMMSPFRQICANADMEPSIMLMNLLKSDQGIGYNIITGTLCNLIATGIIDPLKVTISALENAVSVSGLMLMIDALIIDESTNS